MASKNPNTVATKWKDRLQAAQTEMENSVRGVTVNPATLAIAQKEAMKAGFTAAVNSGKWERNLQKVQLPDWQNAMIQIGIPRAVQGAADKVGKVEKFMTKFLPYVDNVRKQIKQMPNVSDQDKKNRMLKNFELMKAFANT